MAERVKMSIVERAKQFAPFAALKGYDEMVAHAEEKPCERKVLTEEQANKLSVCMSQIKKGDMVSVRYYRKDKYVDMLGIVTFVDTSARIISVVKTNIFFDDILSINKEIQ